MGAWHTAIAVLTVFLFAIPAQGQIRLDGTTGFVRNDQVLTWSALHHGRTDLAPGLQLTVDSGLSSSLNRTTAGQDRWYDSVRNSALFAYDARRNLQVTITALEDWNRDSFSSYGGSLMTTSLESMVNYRPRRNLRMSAGLGRMYDRRFRNEDQGTTGSGSLRYDAAPMRTIAASVELEGAASDMKRAENAVKVKGTLSMNSGLGDMSLELLENRRTQGYFSDVDRQKVEDRERIEESMSFSLARGDITARKNSLALLLTAVAGAKQVTDTANHDVQSSKYRNNSTGDVREFSMTVARGFGDHLFSSVETAYSFDDNRVERASRSRTQTDVSMKGQIGANFGADSLAANGWIKRSRIDTPAGVPNDRDELKFEGGLRYLHNFSMNLQTGLDFRVLETHYVNIDASQSTQNKWIKTYQFSPFLVFSPVRSVLWRHQVNLFANSMNYDFDSPSNPRSNLNRRVSAESALDAVFSPRTKLTAGFMIESNEYGNLDRMNRILPVEEGIRRSFDIVVDHRFAGWLRLSPQCGYAVRRDNDAEKDEVIRREIDTTFGISGSLFESLTGDYHLTFRVKRIIRDTDAYPTRIRDYIDVTMNYGF
jgi:hypothetical protein